MITDISPQADMDFTTWLTGVDQSTWLTIGCSVHDLSDCLLRDWYDMGVSSGDATARAIEENFPEFFERVPQFPKAVDIPCGFCGWIDGEHAPGCLRDPRDYVETKTMKAFPKFPKSHGDIGRTASYMASMRMTLEK